MSCGPCVQNFSDREKPRPPVRSSIDRESFPGDIVPSDFRQDHGIPNVIGSRPSDPDTKASGVANLAALRAISAVFRNGIPGTILAPKVHSLSPYCVVP